MYGEYEWGRTDGYPDLCLPRGRQEGVANGEKWSNYRRSMSGGMSGEFAFTCW